MTEGARKTGGSKKVFKARKSHDTDARGGPDKKAVRTGGRSSEGISLTLLAGRGSTEGYVPVDETKRNGRS